MSKYKHRQYNPTNRNKIIRAIIKSKQFREMKYSIRLTKKDYTKFEKAYNKKMSFTCKGVNIQLIVCSSDTTLFSISCRDKETFLSIEKIEQSYFGTTSIFGDNCLIKIHESKPVDITLKMNSGMIPKPRKVEKIFSFIFK